MAKPTHTSSDFTKARKTPWNDWDIVTEIVVCKQKIHVGTFIE